jgi:hypothetical protein
MIEKGLLASVGMALAAAAVLLPANTATQRPQRQRTPNAEHQKEETRLIIRLRPGLREGEDRTQNPALAAEEPKDATTPHTAATSARAIGADEAGEATEDGPETAAYAVVEPSQETGPPLPEDPAGAAPRPRGLLGLLLGRCRTRKNPENGHASGVLRRVFFRAARTPQEAASDTAAGSCEPASSLNGGVHASLEASETNGSRTAAEPAPDALGEAKEPRDALGEAKEPPAAADAIHDADGQETPPELENTAPVRPIPDHALERAAEAPTPEAPTHEAPTPEAAPEAPVTDAPVADAPSTDAIDAPAADAPATDAPVTDAPSTDAANAPAADAPTHPSPQTTEPPWRSDPETLVYNFSGYAPLSAEERRRLHAAREAGTFVAPAQVTWPALLGCQTISQSERAAILDLIAGTRPAGVREALDVALREETSLRPKVLQTLKTLEAER